jgi:hypothetical protein
MPATKEELQERAQLVRIHEANCQLEHPTPEESNFRIAIMKQLGTAYQLRELRDKQITGPVQPTAQRQAIKTR